MVLILGERLASVSTDFDRMRAKRFEHALKERRRGPRIGLAEARAAREGSSAQTNGRPAAAFEAGHKQHPSQVTKQQVQAQVLETEQDRLLVQELESMADSVKEAEGETQREGGKGRQRQRQKDERQREGGRGRGRGRERLGKIS